MPNLLRGLLAALFVGLQSVYPAGAQQVGEKNTKAAQPAAAQTAAPARPAADDKEATAPLDPTGSWKWEFETPDGNKMDFVLKLNWDGKQLDGKYTAFDNTTKVEQGKVDKDSVSFVVRPEFGGASFDVKFTGKVTKDEINGTINLDFGGGAQEIPWTAKRFVDVDDVVGVWNLSIDAPNIGEIQSILTITKDDQGLHGKYKNDFFDLDAKNVQIKDNHLQFEISSDNGDQGFSSKYQGTPRGNTMEGKSNFDFGGNTGEMKFTGKRQPPKEEKKKEDAARPAATRPADGRSDAKEAATTKSDGK